MPEKGWKAATLREATYDRLLKLSKERKQSIDQLIASLLPPEPQLIGVSE